MALLVIQLGRFQWVVESNIARVSRETEEPEVHEVESETALDETPAPYPMGFQRRDTPPSREEDDDGME